MRFAPVKATLLSLATTALRYTASASTPGSVNDTAAFISSKGNSFLVNTTRRSASSNTSAFTMPIVDPKYPGTAVERLTNVHKRVKELVEKDALSGTSWEEIRRQILWAGGLRDLPDSRPGQGYTGHSFNDFNHVDLTCMRDGMSDNENDGSVEGIALGNRLGHGIRVASLPELGPGGSWSTCAMGCHKDPPSDVAHVQFQARIAFKLVWVPNNGAYDTFVLVDDDGKLLAQGKPNDVAGLPALSQRQMNYKLVAGSKYSKEADKLAKTVAAASE